jgi:hypothetical protein
VTLESESEPVNLQLMLSHDLALKYYRKVGTVQHHQSVFWCAGGAAAHRLHGLARRHDKGHSLRPGLFWGSIAVSFFHRMLLQRGEGMRGGRWSKRGERRRES